jgi:hypothetical protein
MKIGLAALAFAFIASGLYNILKARESYRPRENQPEEPPREYLVRKRVIGALWCVLGTLVAVYYIVQLVRA